MFLQLPHGLLAVSIMTTLGPELASLARRDEIAALRSRFSLGLRSLLVVIAPASVGGIVLAHQVVAGLLQHGDFGASSTVLTANALRAFSVGLVPFSAYLYTLRGFYAMRDTRTPFVVNCLENALNIVLAALLYPHFGISGLAYAFSFSYAVAALVALLAFRARLGGLDGRRTAGTAAKSAGAAGALAIATAVIAHAISNALAATVIGATVGLAVYLGVLLALGADELRATIAAVRRAG
jgi:putative peptidoglycan lipid II flippase